jgi:hypothetical protein
VSAAIGVFEARRKDSAWVRQFEGRLEAEMLAQDKRAILEREEAKCVAERVRRRRSHPTGPKYRQSNLFESMT